MLSTPSVSDAALIRRKRPRSPTTVTTATATAAMDPQRLLSFANFTSAVLDAHRPAPVVLPGISHLLSGGSGSSSSSSHQQMKLRTVQRQRVNEQGAFVERRHGSPVPVAVTQSPAAAARSTNANASDEDDDEEVEDKTPWPSANQYHDIFANMDAAKIPVYDLGLDPRGVPLHPEFIYSQPASCMYFLKCAQLLGKGSFGFPRKKKSASELAANKKSSGANSKGKKESSKDFEWRKMSFVTGLPKKQPIVRYITATCYSRATDVSAKKKVFRMHAVMLADATGNGEMGEYVLVHIRAGGSKRVGLRASSSSSEMEIQAIPSSPSTRDYEHNSGDDSSNAVQRPVSPPMASAPSYNSQAASTSPRNKKLLHADFSSSSYSMSSSNGFGKFLMPPSPPQMQPPATGTFEHHASPPMMRHPMLASPPSAYDVSKFNNARQVMRDMILQSCSSRDEMASYVHCLQEELAATMGAETKRDDALSISQCVAQRRRQLERLEFTLDATARRLCAVSAPAGVGAETNAARGACFSEEAQRTTRRSYAQLLLDALKKEVATQQLFASALPLEDGADAMPQLLELRDEEEHMAQRTDLVWRVIRSGRSTPTSASKEDSLASKILAQCELEWLSLVFGAAYLDPVIAQLQELHDEHGRAASVLLPKTLSAVHPCVVVNHRFKRASLAAKTPHLSR